MMLQNDQIWAGRIAQATDLPAAHSGGYFCAGARGLRLVGGRYARPDSNGDRPLSLHIYTSWPCAGMRAHAARGVFG